jgi:hypothetical protein
MFKIIYALLAIKTCQALAWKCDYPEIESPIGTHVLYKEDYDNIVKWLEKDEYCRAKGDTSVYADAGKEKCEYSRDICVFVDNECQLNSERENDSLQECQDLLNNNILDFGLDSGRTPIENETIDIEEPEFDCDAIETTIEETETETDIETEIETETETTAVFEDILTETTTETAETTETTETDESYEEITTETEPFWMGEEIYSSSTSITGSLLLFLSFMVGL